jgi:hypothetical protein
MRQFKPTKGQKHTRAKTKKEKARKHLQRKTWAEDERKPKVKRNGILISEKNK